MNKIMAIHSTSNSRYCIRSLSNTGSPILILLIALLVFFILFAACGVHAEQLDPVVTDATNGALTDVSPTSTPAEQGTIESEVTPPILVATPTSTPADQGTIESEVTPPVLQATPTSTTGTDNTTPPVQIAESPQSPSELNSTVASPLWRMIQSFQRRSRTLVLELMYQNQVRWVH